MYIHVMFMCDVGAHVTSSLRAHAGTVTRCVRVRLLYLYISSIFSIDLPIRAFLWDYPVTTRNREIVELYVEKFLRLLEA